MPAIKRAFLALSALTWSMIGAVAQSGSIAIIDFPSATSLPLYVAEAQGLFAREGVRVNVVSTRSSEEQMGDLLDGKYDIALTALDNVISYQNGQAGGPPPSRKPDLVAVLGVLTVDLPVVVAPEIKTFQNLKGKRLAVDSPHTGFALLLRGLIEKNGVADGEYGFVEAGGSSRRWEALRKGQAVGAILNPTTEANAVAAGYRVLARSTDLIADYPGSVYATTRSWAASNEGDLVRFIRAYLAALDWLYVPENRAQAAEILVKRVGDLKQEQALAVIDDLLSPPGFIRDARVSEQAGRSVLDLRARYGVPKADLGAPLDYIDMSYYERARTAK